MERYISSPLSKLASTVPPMLPPLGGRRRGLPASQIPVRHSATAFQLSAHQRSELTDRSTELSPVGLSSLMPQLALSSRPQGTIPVQKQSLTCWGNCTQDRWDSTELRFLVLMRCGIRI